MTAELVSVFDKHGEEHRMTHANARDMVAHVGWKWRLVEKEPESDQPSSEPVKPSNASEIVSVFDLDGAEHKMTYTNARDMVTHRGWTFEKYVDVAKKSEEPEATEPAEPTTETEEKKAEEPAPESVTEAPAAVEAHPAEPAPSQDVTVDFEAMTAKEVEAWAKENLGIDLDGRWSKARLIAAVREKMAAG